MAKEPTTWATEPMLCLDGAPCYRLDCAWRGCMAINDPIHGGLAPKTEPMTSKLDVFQVSGSDVAVVWVDEEDGEGAWVGQEAAKTKDALRNELDEAKKLRDLETYEYVFVEISAKDWFANNPDVEFYTDMSGYRFESVTTAKKFLAAMRVAVKAARTTFDTGVEWPAWAKQAAEHGWKPPKNWKP